MNDLPNCPKCNSEYTYEDGSLLVCPECAYEWTPESENASNEDELVVKDSNGNILQDGDSVTIIKDLKVKGVASALKKGTKVKNIKLVDGDHNIDCKIDGFGAMSLKSEFVKKYNHINNRRKSMTSRKTRSYTFLFIVNCNINKYKAVNSMES